MEAAFRISTRGAVVLVEWLPGVTTDDVPTAVAAIRAAVAEAKKKHARVAVVHDLRDLPGIGMEYAQTLRQGAEAVGMDAVERLFVVDRSEQRIRGRMVAAAAAVEASFFRTVEAALDHLETKGYAVSDR